MKRAAILLAILAAAAWAAPARGQTATTEAEAGPDFSVQGEYEGTAGTAKIGVQVIALGSGAFQAVFLPGGLPGAGWDGKAKILCDGKTEGTKAAFTPAAGTRKYMGGRPGEFSATEKFPPEGQKDWTAAIEGDRLTGKTDTGEPIEARKVLRKSPALGAKPPAGATVLLAFEPGKAPSLEAWSNDKWKAMDCGCVQVVPKSGSNATKEKFSGAWTLHLEFKTPFMPAARSQGRGNSGVFPPGGREVQVLDSYGLAGKGNECGGIYSDIAPAVNMCLPPLSWQTYDIAYTPAKNGADGGAGAPASYKVVHNGVVIHEKVDLGKGRGGGLNLQDHMNPVSYRNIWIVPEK